MLEWQKSQMIGVCSEKWRILYKYEPEIEENIPLNCITYNFDPDPSPYPQIEAAYTLAKKKYITKMYNLQLRPPLK